MLQWMGGSRRKVAASHTSVKKRQKHYFEQRRQQQHQATATPEGCANDRNSSNQHLREHQSLDILNLLNLSTATPECKPCYPEHGMEDLDADFYSLKDRISGVSKVSQPMVYDAGSSSNHKAEPSSSNRTSFCLPDNMTSDFKKANTTDNTTADLMDGTERKLSVFDLVGDDQTTANLEECSPSEAHMAFSVEGLGNINTETPVNSPHSSDRNVAYQCSSPWKDTGQPDTSNVRERLNDFEKEVDTIIESSKMFQDDSCYRSPVGIDDRDVGRKQKMRTFSDHLHKPYNSESRSYFCDAADYSKRRVSDENEWNAKLAFHGDGEDSFYWRDQQPCEEESFNLNFMNYGKDYTGSRSSAEHHGTKKRDYLETTWRSNLEDSPVRRPQRLERTIDHRSFANELNPDFDFDKVFDKPVWSSVVLDEDKDSHSLRSEESCSSSAVWAKETPISQFVNNTRQRSKREISSFLNLEDKNYLNNELFQETWEDWDVDDQRLKRKSGYGKQARLSNPGKLKSTSHRDSSFRGGLEPSYNWFAEGFTSAGISSGITTERDKPYPFLNPELGSSHRRPSRAPDSIPETWAPKFSVGGTGVNGEDEDDEQNYANCLSANQKSRLAGDMCGFESDTLSENENEQSKEVNHPKNQGDETSSSVAKSLSDENECKEVMEAPHQGNRGEMASRDSFQQMILLERRTLQLVCLNKTLLLDSLKT